MQKYASCLFIYRINMTLFLQYAHKVVCMAFLLFTLTAQQPCEAGQVQRVWLAQSLKGHKHLEDIPPGRAQEGYAETYSRTSASIIGQHGLLNLLGKCLCKQQFLKLENLKMQSKYLSWYHFRSVAEKLSSRAYFLAFWNKVHLQLSDTATSKRSCCEGSFFLPSHCLVFV